VKGQRGTGLGEGNIRKGGYSELKWRYSEKRISASKKKEEREPGSTSKGTLGKGSTWEGMRIFGKTSEWG